TCVAFNKPLAPISVMYIHEIGRMPALPHGAADTALPYCEESVGATMLWPGRKGARCFFTPIGPMPGPPPPCGMQKVLCRFTCDTSAPMSPGRDTPTCALRFAPSMYTCP